jgi:hypothetical protein
MAYFRYKQHLQEREANKQKAQAEAQEAMRKRHGNR